MARTRLGVDGEVVPGFEHEYDRLCGRGAGTARRRIHAEVRRSTSVWGRLGSAVEQRIVDALAGDLDTGAWQRRNAEVVGTDAMDLGARLLVAT